MQDYPFAMADGTPGGAAALAGLGHVAWYGLPPQGAPVWAPVVQAQAFPGAPPQAIPPGAQAPAMPPGFQPQAMPGFQPQAMPPGFQAQAMPPGFQAQAMPPGFQAQAMPPGAQPHAIPAVSPVACPTYTPPGGVTGAQPAHAAAMRQMMGIARTLEQAIPGYQIMLSVLHQVAGTPRGQALTGLDPLLETLKEITVHHHAALGAIRRFLCGEATAEVTAAMARHVARLGQVHQQLRPQLERLGVAAQPELRPSLTGLTPLLTMVDSLAAQSLQAVQAAVGARPQSDSSGGAASGQERS